MRGKERKLVKRIPVWSLALLLACSESTADTRSRREGATTSLPSNEALARQEKRVEELRKIKGRGDPETLVAVAQLIRLCTARGDLVSGERLFDELLDLDLRRSPVLVYGTPPIKVARALGGLGELAAARDLLEVAVDKIKSYGFTLLEEVLEEYRAFTRLQVALDVPLAVARLREIEAKWTASGAGSPAAYADRSNLPLYSERKDDNRLGPSDPAFWLGLEDDSGSLDAGDHGHFDRMIKFSPSAAFETAERLRATVSSLRNLSLITRIRRIGNSAERPPASAKPEEMRGRRPREGPPPTDLELTSIRTDVHAVTRALDRIPGTDSRFEALRAERARLQRLRTQHLNDAWESVEETYIPVESSEFQKRLDQGTVLLYYMVAADHTDLLVFANEGDVTYHRIPVGSEQLEGKIRYLLAEIEHQAVCGGENFDGSPPSEGGGERSAGTARWLFDALLAPAEREIIAGERLLIVADGPLHRLPFAALQRPPKGGRVQYVVEWKPIHFGPSAASYSALLERRQPNRKRLGGLVAFGNPIYDRSTAGGKRPLPYVVRSAASRGHSGRLDPLPGSGREVEQIGKLFKEQGQETRVLLRGKAEEGAVKDALKASFLHFAVHGFVDGAQPEHSFLALSLPEAVVEGEEDGVLEGWEIEDEMRLDAELVTLSACETAVGSKRSGEGPVSLSRAFLGAGARTVLATLWEIDDTATTDLMVRFYRYLLRGSTKDDALRSAQMELLRSTECKDRAPHSWAGFQLNGDWR